MAGSEGDTTVLVRQAIDALTRRVKVLEERLSPATPPHLLEDRSQQPGGSISLPPLVWDQLSADELAATWEAFIAWLSHELAVHKVASLLPKRWWRQAGLVSHLAAYWRWYVEVTEVNPSGQGTAAWHDSFLRFAETVWPSYISRPDQRNTPDPSDLELREWLDARVAQRRESQIPKQHDPGRT